MSKTFEDSSLQESSNWPAYRHSSKIHQDQTEQAEHKSLQNANLSAELRKTKRNLYIATAVIALILIQLFFNYRQISTLDRQLTILSFRNTAPIRAPLAIQGLHQLDKPHDHSIFRPGYPTVGVPVAGNSFNNTLVSTKDLASFDQEVNRLFKPYNDTNCQFKRVGSSVDGGYVICENFARDAEGLVNLGINWVDDFGCELTSWRPIKNYQYDCTITKVKPCPLNNGADSFSPICVGDVTESTHNLTYFTLWDVLKHSNLLKKHIVLKIDTEGGQFTAFRHFPVEFLEYVDQIVLEVHFDEISPERWGNLDIMRTLSQHFINVNYHMNNYGCFKPEIRALRRLPSRAFQVTLVNKRLIKLNSESRSYKQHPLNTPNWEGHPDCQMEP